MRGTPLVLCLLQPLRPMRNLSCPLLMVSVGPIRQLDEMAFVGPATHERASERDREREGGTGKRAQNEMARCAFTPKCFSTTHMTDHRHPPHPR